MAGLKRIYIIQYTSESDGKINDRFDTVSIISKVRVKLV